MIMNFRFPPDYFSVISETILWSIKFLRHAFKTYSFYSIQFATLYTFSYELLCITTQIGLYHPSVEAHCFHYHQLVVYSTHFQLYQLYFRQSLNLLLYYDCKFLKYDLRRYRLNNLISLHYTQYNKEHSFLIYNPEKNQSYQYR